ncbi:GspH/FimT family pseudopilin [Sansalvadorimonas verongulae]|uniref:GspH/FimT family pseudopilin n=1 Tax=Sansalvadorimonas verongulae TaxID=2172824 RepID=UPI0012BB5EA0|nr:GspH/FimT family pseudopilin [Sansalvadorimonas verongulae]MTI13471.1 prepilin-type N-terminal cleavage/methylation domain-containing protein [Sansalvadorimonas verongulae]
MHSHRGYRGITLPELLWAIAIFGILIAAGVPSMVGMTNRIEAESAFRHFRSAVAFARAEAIVRRADVVLCPRLPGTEMCHSGAIGSDEEEERVWKQGWLLFVDRGDSSGTIDESEGDQILKVFDKVDDDVTMKITSSGGGQLQTVSFVPKGSSSPTTFSVLFCLKDDYGDVEFAGLTVVHHGRVRMSDRDEAQEGCNAL